MNTTDRLRDILAFYANYDVRNLTKDRGAQAQDGLRLLDGLTVFSTAETIPPAPLAVRGEQCAESLDEGNLVRCGLVANHGGLHLPEVQVLRRKLAIAEAAALYLQSFEAALSTVRDGLSSCVSSPEDVADRLIQLKAVVTEAQREFERLSNRPLANARFT
jgi:hypothetical protein